MLEIVELIASTQNEVDRHAQRETDVTRSVLASTEREVRPDSRNMQ
jgi:hypothetical protein